MKIYLITDTHFFHAKMVPFCGRPTNFTELIGENLLKACFTKHDVLIHLGDICIGHDELAHDLYIKPWPCKKWLIRGNHDSKSNQWYLDHGWDWIGTKFQDRFYGKNVLFSHTPVRYKEETSGMWGSDSFDINIHGHYHNSMNKLTKERWEELNKIDKDKYDLSVITQRHKLLAVEYTDYKPVLLETFLQL
jgi:calcineurin-like phosphoesterase family protein